MISGIVIGLGETGGPLYEILKETYPDMLGGDLEKGMPPMQGVGFMHVCIPYVKNFVQIVKEYQSRYFPQSTVIHSTVPIGTTQQIPHSCHSPILGRHDDMKFSIKNRYPKYISGPEANSAYAHMKSTGMDCKPIDTDSKTTEALKLLCLAKYGVALALAHYERSVLESAGIMYKDAMLWDEHYNKGVEDNLKRPIFPRLTDKIGGHCVTQNTRLLNEQYPNPMLAEVLKYAEDEDDKPVIYEPSNVYPTAKMGKNVKIGTFSEIGDNVTIGDNVSIGAFCFIPEGVTIEDNAWIGPRVTFSNDMYPPSGKENWEKTLVKQGARIGAGVCVRPGITIGEGALIGVGAVVVHDVPPGETWAGNPAQETTGKGRHYDLRECMKEVQV